MQHPGDRGAQALVRVGDHQLHAAQAAAGETAQEVGPERLRLARPDTELQHLTPSLGVGAHGDDHRSGDDAARTAHLDVGGIEPQVRPCAFDGVLEASTRSSISVHRRDTWLPTPLPGTPTALVVGPSAASIPPRIRSGERRWRRVRGCGTWGVRCGEGCATSDPVMSEAKRPDSLEAVLHAAMGARGAREPGSRSEGGESPDAPAYYSTDSRRMCFDQGKPFVYMTIHRIRDPRLSRFPSWLTTLRSPCGPGNAN